MFSVYTCGVFSSRICVANSRRVPALVYLRRRVWQHWAAFKDSWVGYKCLSEIEFLVLEDESLGKGIFIYGVEYGFLEMGFGVLAPRLRLGERRQLACLSSSCQLSSHELLNSYCKLLNSYSDSVRWMCFPFNRMRNLLQECCIFYISPNVHTAWLA